ncbi:hypothetical protein ERICIV_00206 [Paenibacillus larvae subsp. larvae]|uniref:Uncharacterized protein n=1 Tax=Paenibacillus larvae subsp. larvae TaxID=147375 RepID=A0A2L1TUV2_9BACL|nr:hypothetical protein ERICIII_00206 [Paenibacillus larvae subsp. larvae]AVF29227.1 hypothetical protein ERICIV_00206 [Paenibacillus larvae subsp. larvae]
MTKRFYFPHLQLLRAVVSCFPLVQLMLELAIVNQET